MSIVDFFKNKKMKNKQEQITSEKEINYGGLVDIANILTENNQEVAGIIKLLVDEPKEFAEKFDSWLGEYDFSPEKEPQIITAFFLTGFNVDSHYDFGGYVDWKEEGEEIVWSLKASLLNKNYPIDLEDIKFNHDECGYDAIQIIATCLNTTEYSLVIWDVDGDCYNLFIIPKTKWSQLYHLSESMGIKITNVK